MNINRVLFQQLREADRLAHKFEMSLLGPRDPLSGRFMRGSIGDHEEAIRLRRRADALFELCRQDVCRTLEELREGDMESVDRGPP